MAGRIATRRRPARAARRAGRRLATLSVLAVLLAGCGALTKDPDPADTSRAPGSAVSFTVRSSTGASTTLPGDRPSVLLFFSVECGGCGPTARALAQVKADDLDAADFAVVDIAGYETARDIEGFLAANQASSLAYAIDTDGRLVSGYQVSQLTTVLILTPEGRVTYRAVEPSADTIRDELAKASS